ncbi:HEAT repeat domain-containing protein [Pseudoalteromonas luteoviolacea]|uniref:HEAT repeat domain-containing protein n=1 Tax=Pseudoalteromonas luteoviolacea TaxID=43657 RepID=UPI001B39259A|nr:HEAT repeat domain-containing protein [Pseudoalteromonas luteoviolacea]MBQ4835664.1 HEAT repeat domain-containing protein [Pseudoalteromonas luteoviolacea]
MITLSKATLASALYALAVSGTANADCSAQYQFAIDTRTTFNYDQVSQQSQQTKLKLSGLLSIKAVQHNDELGWWAIKADNVTAGQGQFTSELASYTLPFAFRLAPNGLIRDFWFPTQLNQQNQEQLKGLAYYFQFQRVKNELHQQEQDTLGKYTVSYQFKDSSIHLNKHAYLLRDTAQTALQTVKVASSGHTIVPNTCFFESRKGQETLLFSGQAQSLNLKTKQQYHIESTATVFPSTLFTLPEHLDNWPIANKTLSPEALKQLKISLHNLVKKPDLTDTSAYDLAKQLVQFDAVISSLEGVFLQQALSDEAQMRLFNALGQLDSANSQLLLGNLLIKADKNPLMQFRALRALSQGHQPLSPQLSALLMAQIENGFSSLDSEVTSSFYMTIGAMLHSREPNLQSSQLHDALSEQLSLVSENTTKSALITALGNSRDEQHFEQIDSYLDYHNNSVQKASIRALGMMQTQRAYNSLEKQLSKPVHQNQVALLKALSHYQLQPAASDAVLAIAVNNPTAENRFAAIQALANQQHQDGIKATLKSALKQETSKRNFKAIVELLHATKQQTP